MNEYEEFKYISLFSGIGGMDLGLDRAGMKCVAQVEIDDFCQEVLTKHWPNVPKFKDVKNVGKENLPTADLICGGFPCQPHSYAGKRKGKEDDRNLWPEYLRIIKELKPKYVLGENVPGLITSMLDEILSDLENIGYTCQAFIIPALAFNAPHRRNRVFVLAYSNSSRYIHGQSEIIPTESGVDAQRQFIASGEIVAYTTSKRQQGQREFIKRGSKAQSGEGKAVDAFSGSIGSIWTVEPPVGRVANGIPRRMDRLKSLGNAVVPQVAEFFGINIMEIEKQYGGVV